VSTSIPLAPPDAPHGIRLLPRVLSSSPEGVTSINLGPNWFASVMGTGSSRNAAVTLPIIGQSLTTFALVVWS